MASGASTGCEGEAMKGSKAIFAVAAFVIAATAAASLFPHRLYGKRISGRVVDAATGQPIAGAHVAFLWESGIIPSGFTGHNSRDICYHAAAAVTDARGRFEIAPWKEWSTYDVVVSEPLALVYARNFVPREIALVKGARTVPKERPNEQYALKAFNGPLDERLHSLFWGLANRNCFYGGDSQKNLYPMLKAIYEEARSIEKTKDHEKTVHSIARLAAEAAIAQNPNSPGNDEQVNDFIREHLK
jgi:hypothetical protein